MVDVLIIGAGVAGMTAALNALRNGKSVLIIEQETIGGQISFSPRVENFPTIPSISGMELVDRLYEQVSALGAELELERVTGIEKVGNDFKVYAGKNVYDAHSVIIASGVKHRRLIIPGEEELSGKGVSYCALCDGAFFKGENVAVIGDGNSALQYALLLSTYCPKVYVCTLFDKFFGDKALVDALGKKSNVKIMHNVNSIRFEGENELTGIVFRRPDKSEFTLDVKGCFVAIGQIPDNNGYKNLVDLDKEGYIISDENCATRTDGLYVAGDCRTKQIRQLATAVSDGAIAGFNAGKYVECNN
ncbi:MAG TPA: FAD-dependent oxidoreductase [Clostridia bacterium]|jgi:thioredoxin reductase (NADPH)|nr:FAD-dependent oxidoreductase [Clostridia bacterium]